MHAAPSPLRVHACAPLLCAALLVACSANPPENDGMFRNREPNAGAPDGEAGAAGIADPGQPNDPMPPAAGDGAGEGGGGTAGDLTPVEEECTSVTERREPTVVERSIDQADIIWVVDSSFSMVDEAQRVQQNMNAFVEFVEANQIDVHVVLITAPGFLLVPDPLGSDTSRFRYVNAAVDSGMPLTQLTLQFAAYQDFLRPDAVTHIIAVSDDEDLSPAPLFQDQMRDLLGHDFLFHAIASEDVTGSPVCSALTGTACGGGLTVIGAAAPGCQYYALADATGGAKISICTPPDQWPDFITDTLGQVVVDSIPEPLPCDYLIPDPPQGESLDPDQVNVEYTPTGGTPEIFGRVAGVDACGVQPSWYYDAPDAPSQIKLCPGSCGQVAQGGDIRIVFGCDTILVLE